MSAEVFIAAVGMAAPGLNGWPAARAVLRGEQPYQPAEVPAYQPALLPPNERRRASPTVRMAFRVAEEAMQGFSGDEIATVFVSADGDLQIAQRICAALAAPVPLISPTDFHNSVHNAAAGYWSIAGGVRGPSTAISAWDHGLSVGLLEAVSMVIVEQRDTLLVAYDLPAPPPLLDKRAVNNAFGVALLLTRTPTQALARIRWKNSNGNESTLTDRGLEELRRSNPAARVLPLLSALARGATAAVQLPGDHGKTLEITLQSL